MGKLINRIPGLRLLISSLPGSASRMQIEPSASTSIVDLTGSLGVKRHHLVFSM